MDQIRRFVCLFVATWLLLVLSSGALAYQQLLAPEDEAGDLDYFGYSVDVDGNLAVVGVPAFAGGFVEPSRAYVFEETSSGWAVLTRLQPSVDANDEYYGSAVAISGDTIIVGAHDTNVTIDDVTYARAGAVYIYTYDGVGGWNVQKIVAPDPGGAELFGSSVDIDGDIVIIGTPRWREGTLDHIQGAAYVYSRNAGGPGIWGFVKKITGPEPINYGFGEPVSVSGSTVAIGAPGWYDDSHATGTGAVYLYERDLGGADNWGSITRIAPDSHLYLQFGHAVSLDADTLAVGTYGLPEAYIYERDLNGDDNWGHRITLVPEDSPGNTYGTALSLDGDLLTVGAYLDSTAFSGSGSVYFYYRDKDGTDAWGLVEKQLHPAPDVNDNQYFGYSVSLCTTTILVGAYGDDFLDNDGTADNRGAAYVLELCDQLGGDVDEDYVCYDSDNCPDTHNPDQSDVDGDDIGDACDLGDFDGDGLSDAEEYVFGSNPGSNDSDGDGLTDAEEYAFGSDPNSNDSDGDGLTDAQEFALGTNPTNPDTDGDSVLDGNEVDCESNPLDPESKCIRGMLWLLLLLEDD